MTRRWSGSWARTAAAVLALGALAAWVTLGAGAMQEDDFPHPEHEGLFPLCTGCHEGVPLGDEAALYPTPEQCAACHDGEVEDRVTWRGPSTGVSNVRFDHVEHARRLAQEGDDPASCEACHSGSATKRMEVGDSLQLRTCWSCHAHQAEQHFEDPDCATCHAPLAESRFGLARLEALPAPPDHDSGRFLDEEHGRMAAEDSQRCATCHTRDRCVACHVDTDRPEIQALGAAPADMELPPATARYNQPDSHADEGWFSAHGQAASRDECATCHTSDDCVTCHVRTNTAIDEIPARDQVVAPGAVVSAHAPESHESRFFLRAHSTLAAADEQSCSTCHTETFCTECHDGPSSGGYHPPSFVTRHAADAFGREAECATCHNSQAFCRSCHVESGMGSDGRLGPGYHDAEPLWLLRHGQAARQSLESCASCHAQNECVQCHGVLGSFKVNPHGREFDAKRAWEKNPTVCLACHIKNPLNGNEP